MKKRFLAPGQAKRLRCIACGWTKRVAPADAGAEILYHRDVTCPEKLAPAERAKPTRAIGRAVGQRIAPPKRPRCPTCRESLALVNGAYACIAGCTNEPTVR
jgi:hypothetical protein